MAILCTFHTWIHCISTTIWTLCSTTTWIHWATHHLTLPDMTTVTHRLIPLAVTTVAQAVLVTAQAMDMAAQAVLVMVQAVTKK
ncbi:MAG: hypothetical protein WCR52_16385 [Bacteroidota bacterium]